MICKKCKLNISADCIYHDLDICVFCYHGIEVWDSNGQKVTKKESLILMCPNCGRIAPNQSWWTKNGCIWCIYDKN